MSEKVLVIKLGAFGDVLQADGAIRDIRAHHPQAELVMLTTPPFRRIFERCPHVNRVLAEKRAPRWRLDLMLALRRKLRAEKFDMVYDLQNQPRTAFYYRWFLKGTPWSGMVPGCSHPYIVRNLKSVPSLQRLADQLHAAGVPVVHTMTPDVSWLADDASSLLAAAGVTFPYIVLVPGCSARHPHKRWPYYNELASRLLAQGRKVVIAPGPDELELAQGFSGSVLMSGDRATNWFELAGILKGAQFVVSNDTGPGHLAAHLGTPGLALFGPHTSARVVSIERERFRAIEVPDLAALTVDDVMSALRQHCPDIFAA